MKRKITFPDWTSPAAVTITRGGTKDKPRAVWGTYTEEPAEWLSLRVTLEIAGGSVLFETFDSREEEEARGWKRTGAPHGGTPLPLLNSCGGPRHIMNTSFHSDRKTRTSARKRFAFTGACSLIRRNGGALYERLPTVRA